MGILKADPATRRKTFVLLVGITALGYAVIQWGLPELQHYIEQSESKEEALGLLQLILVLSLLPLLPVAFFIYRIARRTLSSGQFPPPGTKVIHDTVIIEGKAAKRKGYQLMLISLLLAISTLVGALYIYCLLDRLGETVKYQQAPDV